MESQLSKCKRNFVPNGAVRESIGGSTGAADAEQSDSVG